MKIGGRAQFRAYVPFGRRCGVVVSRRGFQGSSIESTLAGKIDHVGTKLTKFEENEIDKRKQLEVRVPAI